MYSLRRTAKSKQPAKPFVRFGFCAPRNGLSGKNSALASKHAGAAVLHTRNQSGVTLIELIVTMGLLAGFMVILTTLFTASVDTRTRTQSFSAVSTDGRFVLARLNYDIRRASAVTTPAALGASSATLTMTIGGSANTYAINSGRLRLVSGANTDFLTGSGTTVSGLTFRRLGNVGGRESIRLSFTLTSAARPVSGPQVQTFTTTVERRP